MRSSKTRRPSGESVPGARRIALAIVGCLLVAGSACSAPLSPRDPASVAEEAFVFGAPLVTTIRTLHTLAPISPPNRLTWQPTLAGPQSRLVVAPNRDTIYVGAPMDLRAGPYVLQVPAISDRYYAFQFLDAYTENNAYVGTRTNGGQAGTYLIAPPGYTAPTPPGMQRISMRTLQFLLLGRFAVTGTADVAGALRYQPEVTLRSLSEVEGRPAPPVPVFAAPAGPPQALVESGVAFFDELGAAMAVNPPGSRAAQRLARRMAGVGIGPGRTPSTTATPSVRRALEVGLERGNARVAAAAANTGDVRDGWSANAKVGRYGDDFELRAVVSRIGWGANVPDEAMYAVSRVDGSGLPYTGGQTYTVTFPAGALPPTDAFWSLSVYGPDLFFVANPEGRYRIGSNDALERNADGSVTLTLSRAAPVSGVANWLPVPEGAFVVMFRNYLPTDRAVSELYRPPPVRVR